MTWKLKPNMSGKMGNHKGNKFIQYKIYFYKVIKIFNELTCIFANLGII